MLRGSIVALVTPMKADGAVDQAAFERLLEFHLAEGTNGVVIAGTTGEAPTRTPENSRNSLPGRLRSAGTESRSSGAAARIPLARPLN